MARDPYDIRAIFDEMTMNLIASLKRNLSRHEAEEERVGFRFDQWQLAKLRALHRYRQDNKRLIGEAGSEANKLIDDVLQQSFDDGQSRFSRMWDKFTNAILKPFGRKRVPVTGEIEFPQDFKETIEPPKPRQPSRSKPADPSKPIPDMHQPLPVPKPKPHSELPKAPPESDFFGMNDKKLKALQDSVKDDLRKGARLLCVRWMTCIGRLSLRLRRIWQPGRSHSTRQSIRRPRTFWREDWMSSFLKTAVVFRCLIMLKWRYGRPASGLHSWVKERSATNGASSP